MVILTYSAYSGHALCGHVVIACWYVGSPSSAPWYFMYRNMFRYYYVSVLCLYGYSVNELFSVSVRAGVWYNFILRDWYMKYWPIC